jgi:hypothetical protein
MTVCGLDSFGSYYGSVIRSCNYVINLRVLLIHFQIDAMFHSLFFFWKTTLHVSGGVSTYHQEHTQLYFEYLVLVKPLLLPADIQLFHYIGR